MQNLSVKGSLSGF